jgi:hypothetical protein
LLANNWVAALALKAVADETGIPKLTNGKSDEKLRAA